MNGFSRGPKRSFLWDTRPGTGPPLAWQAHVPPFKTLSQASESVALRVPTGRRRDTPVCAACPAPGVLAGGALPLPSAQLPQPNVSPRPFRHLELHLRTRTFPFLLDLVELTNSSQSRREWTPDSLISYAAYSESSRKVRNAARKFIRVSPQNVTPDSFVRTATGWQG